MSTPVFAVTVVSLVAALLAACGRSPHMDGEAGLAAPPPAVDAGSALGQRPARAVAPRTRRPLESSELPDDFRLELGLGLQLHLVVTATGDLTLAYGAAPTLSPVAAKLQHEVSHLTWSSSVPRERVQALWTAIYRGEHRAQRTPILGPDHRMHPPRGSMVAGIRVSANSAFSELWAGESATNSLVTSGEYFEVLEAVRAALSGHFPIGSELDRALAALRQGVHQCVRSGGAVELWLEFEASSGRTQAVKVLQPGGGATLRCAERAARAISFPPLGGSGTARIRLRTQAQDASLEVVTDVPAELQIDDVIFGRTNERVVLAPGRHRLVVVASNKQAKHESSIALFSGERARLDLHTPFDAPPVPADLEIGIVRTSRDGRHPAYSLRVDAVGKVRYEGYHHVRAWGVHEGRVPAQQVADLWQSYLDVADAIKPEQQPTTHAGPRLFTDGPSARIVVRGLGRVTSLDLDGSELTVERVMRVAELAAQLDRALGSERWTGIATADPRCAWEVSQTDLKVRLEALVRARCDGADTIPMQLDVGVLGQTGVVGRLTTSGYTVNACVKRAVPLVAFPRCDVPSYSAHIDLFGPARPLAGRILGRTVGDASFEPNVPPRPGLGDGVQTLGGTLTVLHVELASRLSHGSTLREPRDGQIFVLAHTRFVPTRPGNPMPELELDDVWGERWAHDQAATALLAPSARRELSTVVFEVPALAVHGARDFAWGFYEEPYARIAELHGDVRVIMKPSSGPEQVALPSTRIAVTSALQQGWVREASWIPDALTRLRNAAKSDAHALLPDRNQWLRIDHALAQTEGDFRTRTLRRDPSANTGSDANAGLRLAYMRVDGQWTLAGQRKVDLQWFAQPGAWSHACSKEDQEIAALLRPEHASASAESCAFYGFVAPWSCLAAFVPGAPEEALRLRIEMHRSRCGPRDPLLMGQP